MRLQLARNEDLAKKFVGINRPYIVGERGLGSHKALYATNPELEVLKIIKYIGIHEFVPTDSITALQGIANLRVYENVLPLEPLLELKRLIEYEELNIKRDIITKGINGQINSRKRVVVLNKLLQRNKELHQEWFELHTVPFVILNIEYYHGKKSLKPVEIFGVPFVSFPIEVIECNNLWYTATKGVIKVKKPLISLATSRELVSSNLMVTVCIGFKGATVAKFHLKGK